MDNKKRKPYHSTIRTRWDHSKTKLTWVGSGVCFAIGAVILILYYTLALRTGKPPLYYVLIALFQFLGLVLVVVDWIDLTQKDFMNYYRYTGGKYLDYDSLSPANKVFQKAVRIIILLFGFFVLCAPFLFKA